MSFKIDSAGRILLPKHLRDRLGLQPGTELELAETPDGIVVKRKVPLPPAPIYKKTRPVWTVSGSFTVRTPSPREEQLRKAWEEAPDKPSKIH